MTNENQSPSSETAAAAAIIFRDHILTDVREENKRLTEENLRLQPLRDYLNKVEIRCTVINDLWEIEGDGDVIATTGFDQAKFRIIDDNKFEACFNIECAPRPLSNFSDNDDEDGRTDISIWMANQRVGSFYGSRKSLEIESGEDDDYINLTIIEDKFHLTGKVRGLGYRNLQHFNDGSYGIEEMMVILDEGLQLPNTTTFTPFEIKIVGTPQLRETIGLLCSSFPKKRSYSNSIGDDFPPNHVQKRQLILDALGTNSQMDLLVENRRLLRENENLQKIKTMIGTIEISSSSGKVVLALEDGEVSVDDEGEPIWRLRLAKEDFVRIIIERRDSLSLSFSGIKMSIGSNEMIGIGRGGNYVNKCFGGFSDVEISESVVTLSGLLIQKSSTSRTSRSYMWAGTFTLDSVYLNLCKIENVLDMLGID